VQQGVTYVKKCLPHDAHPGEVEEVGRGDQCHRGKMMDEHVSAHTGADADEAAHYLVQVAMEHEKHVPAKVILSRCASDPPNKPRQCRFQSQEI